MSAHDPYSASQARLEWIQHLESSFAKFRQDLRQILYENGVPSNPGWTEDDIVRAIRQLLELKSGKGL
jgi:hypothetical protein